ncbi:MAG: hypothetical protein EU539_04665, partial [Promethearchaeota archaeon]
MTSDISSVINVFSKFMDPKFHKKVKDVEEILSLPIFAYKFIDEEVAKVLEEHFDITSIQNIAKLNKEHPFESLINLKFDDDSSEESDELEKIKTILEEIKEKYPNIETHLKKAITISSLVYNIKNGKIQAEKKGQKIIVVGLDNAGKTAILNKFGGRLGITDLAKIKPTKGVSRKHVKTNALDLFIWDFGGQETQRKRYFKDPDKYFLQLDLLLYVIDVQDLDKFDQSFDYFSGILENLVTLEENPYILIFIHKYDPDLRKDPKILLNVEFLQDSLKEIFESYEFDYEIYLTSI